MPQDSRVGRLDYNAPWWPANYRAGTWAWLLHRITGLALVVYLFIHILAISFAALSWGGFSFDQAMALLHTRPFLVLDLGLLAILLFHTLNGIRILLFDLGIGIRSQQQLFWLALSVSLLGETAAVVAWLPRILEVG